MVEQQHARTRLIRRTGDWLGARVGDEIMLMSVSRGQYLGMNAVGARIWELIEQPTEVRAICATLVREYDVTPEDCSAQVEACLDDMEMQRLVAIDRPASE